MAGKEQPLELRGRLRRAEQEALHFRAAERAQQFLLRLRLDASAVVVMWRSLAIFTTARTIADDASGSSRALTKQRSILILSNGSLYLPSLIAALALCIAALLSLLSR
jgi:hypothetical protein